MKHIYLDKLFLIFLIIIIFTGNLNLFWPYFLLLLIHELGHAITGIILGYKLDKIILYPCGGVTKFNLPQNIFIYRELLILIMGPIIQEVGFLFLRNYFNNISIYHYTLLIFNLLPIYPLDGGKIMHLLCSYFFNYLISIKVSFIISLLVLSFLFIYNMKFFNLNLLLMLIFLFYKLIKFYQNRYYYYNRFLLERYLNNYAFKRIKNISNIHSFYRDCQHYLSFQPEKEVLNKYFKI